MEITSFKRKHRPPLVLMINVYIRKKRKEENEEKTIFIQE